MVPSLSSSTVTLYKAILVGRASSGNMKLLLPIFLLRGKDVVIFPSQLGLCPSYFCMVGHTQAWPTRAVLRYSLCC